MTVWVMNNVVFSENMAEYQVQTNEKIDLLGLTLRLDDIEDELFELRLTPVRDQDGIYQALLGRLIDRQKDYTAQRNAILDPQK